MVYALAHNYGFTEDFILWQLPYPRALRYLHAALWANGAWTIKPLPTPEPEYNRLLSLALTLNDEDEA